MKKLGKLTVLTINEYESLVCRTEDAEAHAADFAEELTRVHAQREVGILAAFNAGKFHGAGGYGKCLVATKAKLKEAQEQIARYKPIGDIFQPSEALTAILQDVTGVSDVDAAADFEVVGEQVIRAKAKL